jgi:hypothetical protein
MSDCEELDQTDEEIPRAEVSDEALEAASVAPRGLPTLLHNTYCFACPVDNSQSRYCPPVQACCNRVLS